jgi:hypothetical protein
MLVYPLIAYHFKMLIAPAHSLTLALPTTAAIDTAQFVHARDVLLVANDPLHPINACFKKYGYNVIHNLVAVTAVDVDALEYNKLDAAGVLVIAMQSAGVLIAMQLVPRGYRLQYTALSHLRLRVPDGTEPWRHMMSFTNTLIK